MKILRRRFILVSMCSMFIVLATILTGINIWNYQEVLKKIDERCSILVDYDGFFPKPMARDGEKDSQMQPRELPPDEYPGGRERFGDKYFTAETPYQIRYFSVTTDEKGEAIDTRTENIAAVSSDLAKEYAKKVIDGGKEKGFAEVYRYAVKATDSGFLVVFVDCEQELITFRSTLTTSVIVSIGGLLAVFILVWLFSKMVFRPVEESYKRQKQFVTNASHELKTPLTIMNADVEVLELENGESRWTKSIRNQVGRMSHLVNQMVDLSRLDEYEGENERKDFSLSNAVYETAKSYETVAKAKGKSLHLDIDEDVNYTGNEAWIRQAIGLLMDNAIKYSSSGAVLGISLQVKGKKRILQFENPCDFIGKGKKDMLFERFYRLDSSHNSQTGGAGIGLSVVKSIIEKHRGQIHAVSETGEDFKIMIIL